MISHDDHKLLVEAIALSEQNPNPAPMDLGYASALRAILTMLTNRSNAQMYAVGRDSLTNFKNRQKKATKNTPY